MKHLIFLLIVLACSLSISAQGFEYGTPADLKGLTKIFLNTGTDTVNRNRIIETITKSKIGVTFLSSADDAEIIMAFSGGTTDTTVGATTNVTTNPYGGTANTNIVTVPLDDGAGTVFTRSWGAEKPKLILSMQNSQQSRAEKRPSTKFAKAFIKAWKAGNGVK